MKTLLLLAFGVVMVAVMCHQAEAAQILMQPSSLINMSREKRQAPAILADPLGDRCCPCEGVQTRIGFCISIHRSDRPVKECCPCKDN